jgi:hypothetical protein
MEASLGAFSDKKQVQMAHCVPPVPKLGIVGAPNDVQYLLQ